MWPLKFSLTKSAKQNIWSIQGDGREEIAGVSPAEAQEREKEGKGRDNWDLTHVLILSTTQSGTIGNEGHGKHRYIKYNGYPLSRM